ncbi:hypothetical protein ABW19_dt0210043 [Dactylella cylindrospora]|nr:hypothetical protein ABW19_dt0210043 [Dactylella cylindrospora]
MQHIFIFAANLGQKFQHLSRFLRHRLLSHSTSGPPVRPQTYTMNSRIPHALARRLIRPQSSSPFATYSLAYPLYHPPVRNLSVQSFIPRVLSPSWWSQHLPKGVFGSRAKSESLKSRKWNPAWGFVLLALFVGSQSLNIIALRQEMVVFMRRTNARIRALREVVEKIQSGEWEPDGQEVKKALRIGKDSRNDRAWDDVMREIEEEDAAWQAEAQRQREKIEKEEAEKAKFAALASPTAWSQDSSPEPAAAAASPPKKKITADDYYS